jgi:hypothetical protein
MAASCASFSCQRLCQWLGAYLPSRGIILEQLLVKRDIRWSGVASTASMSTNFGIMMTWSLGGERVMMSDIDGMTRKVHCLDPSLEDGSAEDSCGEFWSVCNTLSLYFFLMFC